MSAFDNLEYELYAVLALTYAFPIFARSLKKGESPDWWDIEHGIGIEVARAENKHIGYWKIFSNKYLGKNKKDFSEYELKDLENFNGRTLYGDNGEIFSVCDSEGYFDGKRHIRLAIDTAKAKIEKLDSHYRKFNSNCLFLYMTQSMIDDDTECFLTEYLSIAGNYTAYFNHVFLLSFEELFHFDIVSSNVNPYTFGDKELNELDNNVHELRKASSWDEGTDFLTVLNQIK
ncbi:MAG: hypothetical protein ACOX04_04805 [Candidatus Scatomorpha sp.]|jgi:hypothetical protein